MGGYQGALDDSYYAKYSLIENISGIRNYYDYITRFGHILFDSNLEDITMQISGGINEEYKFGNCSTSIEPQSNKVWTVIKENDDYIVIHLVNLTGIMNDEWNKMKHRPCTVENIEVDALIYDKIKAIHIASPDLNGCNLNNIELTHYNSDQGMRTQFIVPRVDIWTTIFIEKL
jgi:dextranase